MKRIQSLLAALALAAATTANSASVDITWSNAVFSPPGVDVGTINSPAGSTGADAGRFLGVGSNPVGINPSLFYSSFGSIYAYCYDLAETLSGGATITYQIQAVTDTDVLNWLGAANAYLGGGDLAWLNPGSSDVAAAIQLGIWNGLYNNGNLVLNGGLVTYSNVSANVTNIYNAIWGNLGSADLGSNRVIHLYNRGHQDVITGTTEEYDVPEPATLVLLGFAALAARVTRRRKH